MSTQEHGTVARGIRLGIVFTADRLPEELPAFAVAAEAAGYDELWVWEDCFYGGGISASAVALAATRSIRVGLGIMPAVFRNPVATAMEAATLARVFPGRSSRASATASRAGCARSARCRRSRCARSRRRRSPSGGCSTASASACTASTSTWTTSRSCRRPPSRRPLGVRAARLRGRAVGRRDGARRAGAGLLRALGARADRSAAGRRRGASTRTRRRRSSSAAST